MPVGFSKACRTCLALDGTLISIYDSISYDGMGRVTDMIKDITKIKPMKSDGLPELVCQTCLNEINRCYSFKVKCLNSDSTLRKLFAIEEELEISQQQVVNANRNCKPIIQNLTKRNEPEEVELDYDPQMKIKTEKDENDQSYGYFVITSVCSENEQTSGDCGEESVKTFQAPQVYIKEEIDYEIDPYDIISTRRLTMNDVYPSDQSQCFDNNSMELAYPQVKIEPEEQFQFESPLINPALKGGYKCHKCNKEFLYSSRLKKHMRSHNTKPYVCTTCNRGFKLSLQLKNHIDITHRNIKPFKCEECPRTFSFPSKLKEHLRSHKGIKYFKNNYSPLANSILSNTAENEYAKEEKPIFSSQSCNKLPSSDLDESLIIWTSERFTRSSARIHREEMKAPNNEKIESQPSHGNNETSDIKLNTRLSEKLTQNDSSFDGQIQNVDDKNSSEGSRQFICPHCNREFKYLSRLNEHLVCHSDARPFDCVHCGKFFKTPGQLTRHIKTSHKVSSFRSRRRPFSKRRGLKHKSFIKNFLSDPIQDKTNVFDQNDQYRTENENDDIQKESAVIDEPNKNSLIDETPANLPINSKSQNVDEFNLKPESKSDKNSIDSPSKFLQNKITENSTEISPSTTVKHEIHDPAEISADGPKIFHCEKCDEIFNVSARFYKHMRGHGIERPFICSYCGRGFKNCGNLKSHIMITHKKLKPFKCNDCKRTFSCKSNLNKHLTSRIWTHSCIKEFNGRHGGPKKRIKSKKQVNSEDESSEMRFKDDENKKETEEITEGSGVNVELSGTAENDIIYSKSESEILEESYAEEGSLKKKPKHRFECHECKKWFVYESYLKKHLQSHSTERPFICTICDKAFKYKVSLKSHNIITHAKIKPYKCDKCPQAFVNEYTYRVHRNSHNKANKRKAKNKRRQALIKSRFTRSIISDLKESNLNAEEISDKTKSLLTSCSMCSLSVESENLSQHMQNYHHTTESKNADDNVNNDSIEAENPNSELSSSFECPVCMKVFVFASYLKKHMRCHNDERPHVCSICGKAFKDQWRLRSHIREKHASHSKKLNYRLKRRNINQVKAFSDVKSVADGLNDDKNDEISDISNIPQDLMNLSINEDSSHDKANNSTDTISKQPEVPNVEVSKPKCSHCDRVFQFASQLETHIRTHTGERPFVCQICNKTFTQNGHLKNHILINHKKIMPFQCSFCSRGFASGFNMRAHEKTHLNPRRKKVVKPEPVAEQSFENTSATETHQNTHNELQDQVILDFEKLELHPLFGSMSISQEEKTNNEQKSFYPCSGCKKTFAFKSDLLEHTRTHHSDAKPFDCSICFKSFKQEAHLKNHVQMSHTKKRTHKCNECDRVFLTFYILNKHMRSHKSKKNRSKSKPKRAYKKKEHIIQSNYDSEQPTINTGNDSTNEEQSEIVSNEILTEIVNQQEQAETTIMRKSIQITCALCSVSVDSESLTDHMKQCLSISQTNNILLKEEPLDDQPRIEHPLFKTLSNQEDQNIDTGISKQCPECKEEFCSFALFADHMMTHNVEKPFICKTCDKGFKKNAHLKSHIMIVHKRILPYKCIECCRAFSSKYNLQTHMKTHASKSNFKKGNSKRRVLVKNTYYKDPTYYAKSASTENKQTKPHEENAVDPTTQTQTEQRDKQSSYSRNENKIRCTLCFVSVHAENLSKHMQEFHNLPESLTLMAIKKEPTEQPEQVRNRPSVSGTGTNQTETQRLLQCPTCDKEFIHLSRLNEHMRAHSDERPFICFACGKTFKRHGHLTAHMAVCRIKAKPFRCKECLQDFPSSLDLDVHLQTHVNNQHSSSFLNDINLQNEINFEAPQVSGTFPLSSVGAECVENLSSATEETHPCTLCPTVFKSISHLMEHMKVHTSDQPFICSLCGKGFSSNDDLITHRLIRHSKSKPYQCDQCVRKFRTNIELEKHQHIHTVSYNRIQELKCRRKKNINHNFDPKFDLPHCGICKKDFVNNWVLKEHMKCHSSEKPFVCPICGHGFSKKYNLKIHIMAHKKIKPFKCLYCPQSYCTNSGRTHHMKTHTHGRKRIDFDSLNIKKLHTFTSKPNDSDQQEKK